RLVRYLASVADIDTIRMQPISATRSQDAFGSIWRMDRRPWHLEQPALPEPCFAGYRFPEASHFAVPDLRETARQRMAEHPDSFHVCYIGWGLFEQSWRIRGFENTLMDSIAEPAFYEELLDRLTELYLAHVAQCADIPADAIMFGDDWGDQRGVILGPERWRRFLKPRWARIYEATHAQGKVVISHSCGSVTDIMPDIIEIGLDVLESVQPEAANMNPYALKKRWGDQITFYGGLGSQSVIPFGTPAEIRAEVQKLCQEMGRGGGYILHPAKSIQPGTPPENMAAVFEAFTKQDWW
ncbi:MAG: hypothetical protein FJZ90_16310, partial [Chloroflexi bacterium]|nr:hypothetical protein [Chloroflexota bacterium]